MEDTSEDFTDCKHPQGCYEKPIDRQLSFLFWVVRKNLYIDRHFNCPKIGKHKRSRSSSSSSSSSSSASSSSSSKTNRKGRYEIPETLFEQYLSMLRDESSHQLHSNKPETITKRHNKPDLRNAISKKYKPYHREDVMCYNCKQKGHYQASCPKSRKVCSKCNLLGHEADQCRTGQGKHAGLQTKDRASAHVDALIVPDQVQEVPVIVGQPFVNNESVTVVVRGNQIRLYDQNLNKIGTLDEFLSKKVELVSAETTVIPPNYMGHIVIKQDESVRDVLVNLQTRDWSDNCHVILPCILNLENSFCCVPVMNLSNKPVCYEKNRVITRGWTCYENVEPSESLMCLQTSTTHLIPITLDDVKGLINPQLNEVDRANLLQLINKYRDCFALSLNEVGKTDVAELEIKLNDDQPITYRPYRMPYTNRETFRDIVRDLLANKIIQESDSPYASPILLVKKNVHRL
ncbi:unnamed protein product [Acanthoscelides obtectus]|uniref:CCHC-type domain-containing protein n=1 Tax=Acanthoscelides obtectus TaxID=200917 RepID=A0A9P0QAL3_ACAOB|nr:unnamed protein product [Acanthoscelides obtectus]CAK1671944.1 Gag-Pol polyprotein [Acanthoscelides obtectus]